MLSGLVVLGLWFLVLVVEAISVRITIRNMRFDMQKLKCEVNALTEQIKVMNLRRNTTVQMEADHDAAVARRLSRIEEMLKERAMIEVGDGNQAN